MTMMMSSKMKRMMKIIMWIWTTSTTSLRTSLESCKEDAMTWTWMILMPLLTNSSKMLLRHLTNFRVQTFKRANRSRALDSSTSFTIEIKGVMTRTVQMKERTNTIKMQIKAPINSNKKCHLHKKMMTTKSSELAFIMKISKLSEKRKSSVFRKKAGKDHFLGMM